MQQYLDYTILIQGKYIYLGRLGIILIISGALGNLIDRVRLGFVVDYFDFRIIWEYVFNIADVFVVVGTVFLCIYVLFFESKSR